MISLSACSPLTARSLINKYDCVRDADIKTQESKELCERRGGRPKLPVPNSPYGLCGRERALEEVYVCVQSSGAV